MTLLAAEGLDLRFGGVHALRDVTVVVNAGETLGMIGPNGSGKTTFVNAVTGHLRPDGGRVRFDGRDATRRRPHDLARLGLVRTYQSVRVFPTLTLHENLDRARLPLGASAPAWADLEELAGWLRLDLALPQAAGGLTLFEQRRLEILMRLALRPKLIMLDEPAAGLAPGEAREMIQLLTELRARTTLFIIEHTMRAIRALADRVVVLMAGEKVAEGPPETILRDPRVTEQYLGVPHAAN